MAAGFTRCLCFTVLAGLDILGWLTSTFPHFLCFYILTAAPVLVSAPTNSGDRDGSSRSFTWSKCRFWGHTSVFCLVRFEIWSRDLIDLELPESVRKEVHRPYCEKHWQVCCYDAWLMVTAACDLDPFLFCPCHSHRELEVLCSL